MTANEFEALIAWQQEQIADLKATLGLLEAFHKDTIALHEAHAQLNGKLTMSMEVFDPAYPWDNTGAYEN